MFAFTDGLSSGELELEGMSEALGAAWSARLENAEALPLDAAGKVRWAHRRQDRLFLVRAAR